MAALNDFVSRYTGVQIEELLAEVPNKIAKADIVSTITDDNLSPVAASVAYALDLRLKTAEDTLKNKVLLLDGGGTQTIGGEKTFSSLLTAAAGITVPVNKFIETNTAASSDKQVPNFAQLKTYGVKAPAANTGIRSVTSADGFKTFSLHGSVVPALPATIAPNTLLAFGSDLLPYAVTVTALGDSVFQDNRWLAMQSDVSNRLLITTYNSDQTAVNSAINTKLALTTYNTDKASLLTTIGLKLDTSTFNTFQTSNTTALGTKLNVTTYNSDQTALNAAVSAKVDTSTFSTYQTTVTNALLTKMDYTVTGTVTLAASGTAIVATIPKTAIVAVLIVTVVFTGTLKPCVFRVTLSCNNDTTAAINTEAIVDGAVTFTATISGTGMRLNAVNGGTIAGSVKYKTLVQY